MTTTIILPEALAAQVRQRASLHQRSVEALVIEYVESALANDQALEALVDRIQAFPPNLQNPRPAANDLAEVLRQLETMTTSSDVATESAALRAAEIELQHINRANDRAEGHG
jgi:hypothetical protein